MTGLSDRLKRAAKTVDAAGLPDDLRAPAFHAAFWSAIDREDLPTPQTEQDSRPAEHAAKEQPGQTTRPDGEGEPTSRLSMALGVEPEEAALVYDLEGEEIALLVPPRLLPDSLRPAAEQVTYLIVGARQALGETWTPVSVVKEALEGRGYVDKNRNLHKLWDDLDGRGLSVKGSGRGRQLKMNGAGFKKAGDLVRHIASEVSN